MKRKDLISITTVALGTATLTVATFLTASLEAGAHSDAPSARIASPKFVSQGVEMSVTTADGKAPKAGEKPALEIKAVNTTDRPARVSTGVSMTASAPLDRMSRVAAAPQPILTQVQQVELQPRESRVITVSADKSLPANSSITVSLSEAPRSPSAAPKTTVSPSSATRIAASRLQTSSSSRPGVTVMSFSTASPSRSARATR